jgi:CubicO group peptidase (beta-lactamase class C family)
MRKLIRGAFTAFLVLLSVLAPPSKAISRAPQLHGSDQEIAAFFDGYMKERMRSLGIPGAAVIVVRDGLEILARGYGYADLASHRRVDVNSTVFRAASISKLVPWLLVMQLVEEGRLDLDADVNRYLDFRIPERFGQPITMRHLMTHTAGFPERFHGVFDQDLSQSLDERLRRNIPERVFPPGTTIAYSNYGPALAGYIVQRLRHRPWDLVAGERFLQPLRMTGSTILQPVPAAMQPRLASTYSFGSEEPGPFRVTPLAPMGSLSPTAADMGRLLRLLANRGSLDGVRIVRPETLQQMFTLQMALGPGLPDGFGLGFLVGDYRGVHYAGHAGNMSTLATDLEVLPDVGLAWYYVFNSQGEGEGARQIRDELLHRAIDRFVAEGPMDNRPVGPSSAREVQGQYTSSRRIYSGPLMMTGLMNTTDVAANPDGTLTILTAGRLSHWLPRGRDRFVEDGTGIPLSVTRDPNGRVTRIASSSLYPAAIFERAPAVVTYVPLVAFGSLGILLLTLLTKPLALWLGRRARARRSDAMRSPGEPVARWISWTRLWAKRSYWLLIATLVSWALFAVALATDFTILFTAPALLRWILAGMTLASAPAAAVIVGDAIGAFLDRDRSWASRAWAVPLAASAVGLAWLFYRMDIINGSANW